jgi:hypothetical protein
MDLTLSFPTPYYDAAFETEIGFLWGSASSLSEQPSEYPQPSLWIALISEFLSSFFAQQSDCVNVPQRTRPDPWVSLCLTRATVSVEIT